MTLSQAEVEIVRLRAILHRAEHHPGQPKGGDPRLDDLRQRINRLDAWIVARKFANLARGMDDGRG